MSWLGKLLKNLFKRKRKLITKIMPGRQYKVVGNRAGHGRPIGTVMYCCISAVDYPNGIYIQPGSSFTLYSAPTGGGSYGFYPDDVSEIWTNRKEHADFEEKELQALEKQVAEKKHLIKRLREFDSDEKEIASMLVRALSQEGSEKERIDDLAKLLKGRLRTDLL